MLYNTTPELVPDSEHGSEHSSEHTLPRYVGRISVAPGGRYFVDEVGQGFIVIGQNDAITWPGLNTLLDCANPGATEEYICDLRAHGINVSRVMIEYAETPQGFLEGPVGKFNAPVVEFWDNFISLAEKHGLYLLLTPYDTFWQRHKWQTYPYAARMGGPCPSRRGWLTNRATIEAHKARWDFILARWGSSPNIFAWDLMNEIDNQWRCTPQEIAAYVDEMADYVRSKEVELWGEAHMLTVSTENALPDGLVGDIVYNHPAFDFATTHLYIGPGTRTPSEPIEQIGEIDTVIRASQATMRRPRPYLDTESGPLARWQKDVAKDTLLHHHFSWAHLAAGGAGSGMRWPYTNPHWILPEMRDNLLALARFAAHVDWASFQSRNISDSITLSKPGIVAVGCADHQTAIVWLARDTRIEAGPSLDKAEVRITSDLFDGVYEVQVWDTSEGCAMRQLFAFACEGRLGFTLPRFEIPLDDIALLIRAM